MTVQTAPYRSRLSRIFARNNVGINYQVHLIYTSGEILHGYESTSQLYETFIFKLRHGAPSKIPLA